MHTKRFIRLVSGVVLITFSSLTLQPLSAVAQGPTPQSSRLKAASAPLPLTIEEELSNQLRFVQELTKVAKRKRQANKPYGGEMSALGTSRGTIESLVGQVETSLSDFERVIRAKKPPQAILDRHNSAVASFKTRRAEFSRLLATADEAGDSTRDAALAALDAFFEKYPQGRDHQLLDPAKLPFKRSPDSIRPPATDGKSLRMALAGSQYVRLAGKMPGNVSLPKEATGGPTPEDLAETEDVQITQTIRAKANELGKNPVRIFNWVRNNIHPLPTYGSVQGSEITLLSREGNAFDTASLLIALYRAAGIPSRYVYGSIEMSSDSARNWLGDQGDHEATLSLLGQGRIPSAGVVEGGRVSKIRLEHVWVEAYVDFLPSRGAVNSTPDTWVALDPSFKQYNYSAGLPVSQAIPFDVAGLVSKLQEGAVIDSQAGTYKNLNVNSLQAALFTYTDQVRSYVRAQTTSQDPFAGVGAKTVIAEESPFLRGLPYRVLVQGPRYSTLPQELRMTARVKYFASSIDASAQSEEFSFQISLPRLGLRRLGVTFVPATAEDAELMNDVVADDSLAELPAYLFRLRAELRVDEDTVVRGSAVGMGAAQGFELSILRPGDPEPSSHIFRTTAGDEIVFGVIGSGVTPAVISKRRLDVPTDTAAENLHLTSLHFWVEQDFLSRLKARNLGYGYQMQSGFGTFSSPLVVTASFFGVVRSAAYKGREMDIAQSLIAVAGGSSVQRSLFTQSIGLQGSYLEGAVHDQLFGRPFGQGLSAVQLISDANAQGIPIVAISPGNASATLPLLQLDENTYSDIQNAVAAGKSVVVSQRAPTLPGFSGAGYIVEDSDTGSGAYLISGGLNGGSLPECTCEKVKKPKVQFMKEFLASMLILGLLAGILWGSGGTTAPAAGGVLRSLMALFGLSALAFPMNATAAAQVPLGCCLDSSCPKPGLFRGGNASGPQLEKIRINRPGTSDDDVTYDAPPGMVPIPVGTTCSTATPEILTVRVIADGNGASLYESVNFAGVVWKLGEETFPPPSLCLLKDPKLRGHWLLGPKTDMTFGGLCDALRSANPLFTRQ